MSSIDLEQGNHQNRRRSFAGSDASVCFSDGEDAGSCYSYFYSTAGGSHDEHSFAGVSDGEIDGCGELSGSDRGSSVAASDSSEEIERGVLEIKVQLAKEEGDCRICHLGLDSNKLEYGVPIELGCSCKSDLAAAHKQCAETWFKIKGNKICEICQSIARNVAGTDEIEAFEQSMDANQIAAALASGNNSENRRFWQGQRFLNFLLACMVFAFVISWLFHFNVQSS